MSISSHSAVCTQLNAIFVSLELSRSTWLDVAFAGSGRAHLAAPGEGQRCAGAAGAVRAVAGEGAGADG